MAHVSQFITRNSLLSQHLYRPQLAWTTPLLTTRSASYRQVTTSSVGSFDKTRQNNRTCSGLCYPRTSNWSRAIDSRAITSTLWSEKWYATQRRGFSQASNRHEASKDGQKKDPLNQPEKPTDAPIETTKTTIAASAKVVTERLKSLTPPVLKENIYTVPNLLTTTRIITAPIISYALLHSQPVLAFSLFAYSSITDLVDGYLARRYKSGTVLGSILDPFADKLLMTLTAISLYSIGTFPWWLTLIILGRDGGLLLSALYFRWISLPPPRTMTRYWDFSLPSAEVRPTEISKINTLLQFLLVADAVLLPVLPVSLVESWNLWGVLEGWMALVAGTTVWSGLSYIFTKDAIRFIGQEQGKKKDE